MSSTRPPVKTLWLAAMLGVPVLTFAACGDPHQGVKTFRERTVGLEFRYPAELAVKDASAPPGGSARELTILGAYSILVIRSPLPAPATPATIAATRAATTTELAKTSIGAPLHSSAVVRGGAQGFEVRLRQSAAQYTWLTVLFRGRVQYGITCTSNGAWLARLIRACDLVLRTVRPA